MSAEAPAADGTAVEASSSSTAAAAAVTATPAPAPPPRLENTVACVPVVYGSVAFSLSNKKAAAAASDEINTHQWTLYLRGPNDEDLSPVIERVVFQLHASFARPLREVTTPPYEVTERGWGEFEAQIRITWRDPHEKSTYVSVVVCDVSWLCFVLVCFICVHVPVACVADSLLYRFIFTTPHHITNPTDLARHQTLSSRHTGKRPDRFRGYGNARRGGILR